MAAPTVSAFPPQPGEGVEGYWRRRLAGQSPNLTVDFIQPSQLAVGNGQEAVLARFPVVVCAQIYSGASLSRTHLELLRATNPNIVLLGYHVPFDDQLPGSIGPGFDAVRRLQSIESAYLHDVRGDRLYVTDDAGTRAVFDPRSPDVRAAVKTAIGEILTAYPYDGLYLDNYGIRDGMVLDTQGNQYTGAEGQTKSTVDQAEKLAAIQSLATEIRAAWPMVLFIANSDPAIARHMDKVQDQGGWRPAAVNYDSMVWDGAFARLAGSRPESIASTGPAGLLIHVVQAITGDRILPDTYPLPGTRSDTIEIAASRGEYESASFVIRSPEDGSREVTVVQSDLRNSSTGATIAASSIEIRFVKAWYQSYYGWNDHWKSSADDFRQVLLPELLLKDDGLVRTEAADARNLVRIERAGNQEYVWVNPKQLASSPMVNLSFDDFPVRDASVQQPAMLKGGANKQLWVTLHVPSDALPGDYVGSIDIKANGRSIASLPVHATVHPFALAESRINYSIYYDGQLDLARASISSQYKSSEQMRNELLDIQQHGISQPTMYHQQDARVDVLKAELQIRRDLGMNHGPLYYLGLQTTASSLGQLGIVAETKLRAALPPIMQLVADAGYDQLYIYGRDEAKGAALTEQRPIWKIAHELGAKLFVASNTGAHELVGDLLDTSVAYGNPDYREAQRWHASGKKIFNYGNPQSGPENPYLFRLNYGLVLWANDYDGAMPFAYQYCFGSCWNDLDHPVYRDHNLTYPTVDGAIPTLAWEGMREAVDDVRYLTTLENALAASGADGPAISASRAFLSELKGQVRSMQPLSGTYNRNMGLDLDAVRREVVAHLTAIGAR